MARVLRSDHALQLAQYISAGMQGFTVEIAVISHAVTVLLIGCDIALNAQHTAFGIGCSNPVRKQRLLLRQNEAAPLWCRQCPGQLTGLRRARRIVTDKYCTSSSQQVCVATS